MDKYMRIGKLLAYLHRTPNWGTTFFSFGETTINVKWRGEVLEKSYSVDFSIDISQLLRSCDLEAFIAVQVAFFSHKITEELEGEIQHKAKKC